ncbi:MAG: SCO family protein [Anaerolineales bacterium]|jgi:protein SCO1/2|nr:SCO family protein [Anaerolineales bacterium]
MNKRTFLVGVAAFAVVALAILLTALFSRPANFRGTLYGEPFPLAPEISLTDASGNPFRLNDNRGKITLVFFGYTFCPDVCPTTLAELKLAVDQLNVADASRVQVVFISVDPERDTIEGVQKYVERFNPDFIGLSGTQAELEPIWSGFGVYREIVDGTSATNYIINHTARVTLIDQNGNMRLTYGFQTPPADIAHDIELLLSQ